MINKIKDFVILALLIFGSTFLLSFAFAETINPENPAIIAEFFNPATN